MILLIDNFDSFSYNLVDYLSRGGASIEVRRNNASLTNEELSRYSGVVISPGPETPSKSGNLKKWIPLFIKKMPVLGICLGHQVVALANDVPTYKMYNGHRGINHPVINVKTGRGEITSQNHGFAIKREETEANNELVITHIHLNDDTVAGIRMKDKKVFSVQYHPEASPGPHDSDYLFDEFFEMIRSNVTNDQLV